MFKNFFFGKQYEPLTNADAVKIAIQSILFGCFLAYMFGPTEYGLWGLMAKAAAYFNMI